MVKSTAKSVRHLSQHPIIYGAPEGQDARILAEKARALMLEDRILVHAALNDTRVSTLRELLTFFAPDAQIVSFPAWDCLPYDRVSPHQDISAKRVAVLSKLITWGIESKRKPRILLTTVGAITQRVMPRKALNGKTLRAQTRKPFDLEMAQRCLTANGYIRTETVREPGEFALRGNIFDLFPSGFEQPVRLDLFGDEVETIKYFDPLNQRSGKNVDNFVINPAAEFFLDENSITRFRRQYRDIFGVVRTNDPLYESISEGRRHNGMEHWQPLFFDQMETLFDYLPNAAMIFDHHGEEAHNERLNQIQDFYQARKTLQEAAEKKEKKSKNASLSIAVYNPLPIEQLYLEKTEWKKLTGSAKILSPFRNPLTPDNLHEAKKSRDFADIRALPDSNVFAELKAHITHLTAEKSRKIIIACYSPGSLERLKGLMKSAGFKNLLVIHEYAEIKNLRQVGLTVLGLEHGFVAPDLAIITEQDILGDRLARKTKRRRKADNFLTEVSALSEGDLVVHIDHGIGKFIALETLQAANRLHDCLKIEYASGDRLYVPVENIDVLSRFGRDEGMVQLDKLGGAGWQARKARVKKNLMAIADELLKIAAARQLRKAEKLDVSSDVYNSFAARFPYEETEDQDRAIDDVLADLATDKPMDRLICGDVGFGKTEVAIRAAYVAAMAGTQVALIVPTTLLARQHYQNFLKRFAGTAMRVEQLSRMVPTTDAEKVKQGLADGSVNIVIGTHALFGKTVKFSHLGLLIVDEEQRFGVKQKERLKEIKNNVHVLTLTATPIPRTLQMSLTGVKEMSLITTPPIDRLAVRTFVLPYDQVVIREALLREHYRGGQSFYVCPRIKDIADLENELKELVPEIKAIAAHGKMTPTELEDRMSAFYDGQYDVLLATNIIESGIDIPTANTMIIHRADMFGLAQLYQIRGRIGRSKVRAYAYLTWPAGYKLTDQAQKRLEVMETLDTLGSGFQLASHDMDIRGAGNLLGEQQSGHVKEVGAELYQKMLEDAVTAARSGTDLEAESPDHWSPQINLGTSVLIPETYVEDLGVRMSLYRRVASLENQNDIESIAAELIDRFGDLPSEVQNLLDTVSIKQLCKQAGVSEVEAGPKGAVITFHNNTPPNVENIMEWIAQKRGLIKLRPDQKLVSIGEWPDANKRVKEMRSLFKELANLAN